MSRDEIAAAMQAFEAKGGTVAQLAEGAASESHLLNERVRYCKCGCEGNYTDHSMRQGEGRFADQ